MDVSARTEPIESNAHGMSGAEPPGTRIRLTYRGAIRPTILLPRALLRGRTWLIFAFGIPFVAIPAFSDGGLHDLVVRVPIQLFGLAILGLGCFFVLTRQVIVDNGDHLRIEIDLLGRPVHYSAVQKRDIEQVAVRSVREPSPRADRSRSEPDETDSTARAVYLDASAGRKLCLGPCLKAEELEWLRSTVELWARR